MMWYEKPLGMTVADICKEYREAKDPAKQIEILAQLNDTKTTRIAWLLARAGEEVPANKLPRAPRTEDGVDLDTVWNASPEACEADEVRRMREEKPPEYDGITPIPDPPVRREPAKKEPAKKNPAKKEPAKKNPAKKEPAKKEPAKKNPVNEITAKLWRVYLDAVRDRGSAVDERDVRDMMALRGIAERIGGDGDAEMD